MLSQKLNNFLVYISGFDGFLGSCLTQELLDEGATVVGVLLGNQLKENRIEVFKNNKKFSQYLPSEIKKYRPKITNHELKSVFFHFAGIASATDCQKNPEEAYQINVMLTHDMLELAKSSKVDEFIYPSTGYVYGNNINDLAVENNRLISTNMYTATKIAAESLIEGFSNYYGMQSTIVRISNVYGKESVPETVTGTIINSVLDKVEIRLNTLKPVRDFIYIDDVINGFVAIMKNGSRNECTYVNLSTGIASSIEQLAETACKIASLPPNYIVSKEKDDYADTRLVLNNQFLKTNYSWDFEYTIEKGLSEILNRKGQLL